jgi:hypothetical protein
MGTHMWLKITFASRISTSFQFMDVCVDSNMFVSSADDLFFNHPMELALASSSRV